MSSIHLPSFFTSKKPMETKSMRVKRSTTSFTPEIMNSTTMPEQYEIKRSNTLSKVKRFGSMLVRGNNNKNSRPTMPNFSTSTIPTINTKDLLSNASFSSSDSDSDEETLMTPIDSIPPQVISNKQQQQFFPVFPNVSTVTKNNDDVSEEKGFYFSSSPESFEYTPIDNNQLKLSLALLVQNELGDAFEEADKEFEADLEISRRVMLQSIQSW